MSTLARKNPLLYNVRMGKELELYEIGLLMKPELSETDAAAELGNVRSVLEKNGALLESTTDPKLRKLSYPIQKNSQAYFAALRFSAMPVSINTIEKEVKNNAHLLRHLVLSWTHTPPETVMPRSRRTSTTHVPAPATASSSGESVEKAGEKVDEQELDKKLEEILGQ